MSNLFGCPVVGVQVFPGFAAGLLVNDADGSTKALVVYSADQPVAIEEMTEEPS